MTEQQVKKNTDAIRLMVTANLIAEYAMLEFKDKTKQDLKQRVNVAINACRNVQNWFLNNSSCSPQTRESFKENFLGDEIILLSELLKTCFGVFPSDLETIISSIKANLKECEVTP
jgi:hypothetical protein